MSDKIYFQWQNPILRETIYPAREMKLRHFLLYYHEIDLWKEYKHKADWPIDKFPKERAEFLAAQKKAITAAYNAEVSLKRYFTEEVPDVVAAPGNENNPDVRDLNKLLDNLRRDFKSFFKVEVDDHEATDVSRQAIGRDAESDIAEKSGKQLMTEVEIQKSRDRKEKIFVSMRVSEWERYLKESKRRLARKKTIIEYSDPKPNNLPELEAERDTLRHIVIPGMENELGKLKELAAAQTRLEIRKGEFSNRVAEKIRERDEVLKDLLPKRQELKTWESKKREYERELTRASNRPSVESVLDYFTKDVYQRIADYLRRAGTHQTVIDAVIGHVRKAVDGRGPKFFEEFLNRVKQWLEKNQPSSKVDPSWIVQQINSQSSRFLDAEKKLELAIASLESGLPSMRAQANQKTGQEREFEDRKIGERLQVVGILTDSTLRNLLREEWEKSEELQFALRLAFPTKGDRPNRPPGQVRKDLDNATKKTAAAQQATAKLEAQLEEINDALCIKREKYLKEFIMERRLTIKDDILPFLAEKYYADLLKLKHDQLLYEVFQRFWKEPDRFPLWLQYMVVHFSGMRYASAHGSWADPRDLLLNLRTAEIQDTIEHELADIKTRGLLDASCQQRLSIYEPLLQPMDAAAALSLPADARAAAQDSRFIRRFQQYYKNQLSSPIESKRSRAYLDLRIDEEGCEILAMDGKDVLEELTDLHKERNFPPWMWKEIVKLTDLRLTEVDSKEWETLTADEQAERLYSKDKQMAVYREIMNEWKSRNLTGWRQEHDRSNRLVVTRAVCNEVAEHIQHLRGHVSAAGLTQKPLWYKGAEDRYFEAKDKEEKLPAGEDGKSGTRPYFVRAKDRGDKHHTFEVGASILWLRFVNDSPNEWRIARPMATREGDELVDAAYRGRRSESGSWVYTMGEPTSRMRQKLDKKGKSQGPKETQYLRWMHEATVATVADTAEGKVVLTFETALPYEDPSLSTIGVFKRYLKDLNHDQGEDAYNPAFVGFMPEKTLSRDDVQSMEEMLDWNHIFLKEVITPAQLEEFREKYIRNHKPTRPTVQIVDAAEKEDQGPKPVIGLYTKEQYLKWTESIAQPGTKMYRVRRWGDKAFRGGALNVDVVGSTNFQAVGLYNKATNDFGAVKNFIHIYRDDIDRLRAMQVEDEYLDKKKDWRSQKMTWLCQFAGSIYMFDHELDSWKHSPRIRWGTLALGGNLVQVEDYEVLDIKVKGFEDVAPTVRGGSVRLKMWRLAGFRSTDWNRPLDDLLREGLVHRCFCAGNRNQVNDSPQGIVYSPFFSVADKWDFRSNIQPNALYIPDVYLEEQGSTTPEPKPRQKRGEPKKNKKTRKP